MKNSPARPGQAKLSEQALKMLARLMKASAFYPRRHPALEQTLDKCFQELSALLNHGEILFTVRKSGVFLDDVPVASRTSVLSDLAQDLFARKVNRLMILPDLQKRDIDFFVRSLAIPPQALQKKGGLQELLLKAGISTIWLNISNLEDIEERKAEIEAQNKKHDEEELQERAEQVLAEFNLQDKVQPEENRDIADILKELQSPLDDDRYQLLLQELVALINLKLTEPGTSEVLIAFDLLVIHRRDKNRRAAQRESAAGALKELNTRAFFDFLVATLSIKDIDPELAAMSGEALLFYGKDSVPTLVDRLISEKDAGVRKQISEILIRQGSEALSTLTEYMADDRWYVVRNVVYILGEMRDAKVLPHMTRLLGHDDVRVRRETMRAITKTGGPKAISILLRIVYRDDEEMRRQALLALGALRNSAAVPPLLKILNKEDFWGRNIETKKDIIQALGEIGSEEAVEDLIKVLSLRRLWRRNKYNALRANAAWALGEIGSPQALPILEEALEDRSPDVVRTSMQALKQIRREKNARGTE